MKAAVVTKHGGPEVFQIQERPDPKPKAGESLVRVKAAGVNFADIVGRVGLYQAAPKPPMVLGYEVAGILESAGEGVRDLKEGDRVLGMVMFGGYAELAAALDEGLMKMPDDMSYEHAAAIPVNYVTAYHSLIYMGALKPHETILIHAVAGGVGTAATQIAKHVGATVIGTCSPSKFDYARENGADHLIDYNTQDFLKEVRRITDGRGADMALDALGGPQLNKSYRSLGHAGRLITFGASEVIAGPKRNLLHALRQVLSMKSYRPMTLMGHNKAVIGVDMNAMSRRMDVMAREFEALKQLIGQGVIKPHVDQTFPLDRVGDAHQYIQDRKNKGKVVLTID